MRAALSSLVIFAIALISPSAFSIERARIDIEIRAPENRHTLSGAGSVDVEGVVSLTNGVRELDLILVIDTSRSLRESDPYDQRLNGVIGLLQSLPFTDAVRVGIVAFDREGKLILPLTTDRKAVADAVRKLGRHGFTDVSSGIHEALDGFEGRALEGSTRAVLVFTDGRSDEEGARRAVARARAQGVEIHTLLLGSDPEGRVMLTKIAEGTGGTFHEVKDVSTVARAFEHFHPAGIQGVSLSVNGALPVKASVVSGAFSAPVALQLGENEIVATATALDGTSSSDRVTVMLRAPGCGELQVLATVDGRPARSVSRRSVQVILDSSRSMWRQIGGRAKYEVARETLEDALGWLPPDLRLSLRAYGHQHRREEHNCSDSELLVATSSSDRSEIRAAMLRIRPSGQTPIAYALDQAGRDLTTVEGERAVILLTDGIESCGGDPPAAARVLREHRRIPVHVIGFGLESKLDSDVASLRAIARESGGRFVTAESAGELRHALSKTAGTEFTVAREGRAVARGTLGADERIRLSPGEYTLTLHSVEPVSVPISVGSQVRQSVTFDLENGKLVQSVASSGTGYFQCGDTP
jgi:Mg-chelatase subunit ChlD